MLSRTRCSWCFLSTDFFAAAAVVTDELWLVTSAPLANDWENASHSDLVSCAAGRICHTESQHDKIGDCLGT